MEAGHFKKAWAGPWKAIHGGLIAIFALSAYLYSVVRMGQGSLHLYFDTAAMLIVLVLLGKYLETRAKERISRRPGTRWPIRRSIS
jgi:cation transport ATPase